MSFSRRAASFDLARRAGARFMPEESVPAEGDEDMGYSYSAEWTPELIFSGAAEGAFINAVYIEPGALGVSRVGSGAGVPSAGDAVRVQGALSVSELVNGDTCNVTMPFEIGLPVCPILRADVLNVTDITVTATILGTNTIRLTFGVTSDTEGYVFVDFAYQTANAVD